MNSLFLQNKIFNKSFWLILFFLFNNVSLSSESINYSGPGDNKEGYESKTYTTNSLSLDDRKGKKADLIKYVNIKQLGLPSLKIPEYNPITRKKIELGKKLFFDRRLSLNNTMSCGMCHVPEQGFTNNEIETAVSQIKTILFSERMRRSRQLNLNKVIESLK